MTKEQLEQAYLILVQKESELKHELQITTDAISKIIAGLRKLEQQQQKQQQHENINRFKSSIYLE